MTNPQVRITKGVMDVLRKEAKPFETPQEVLDRLLSKTPCNTSSTARRSESESEIDESDLEDGNESDDK